MQQEEENLDIYLNQLKAFKRIFKIKSDENIELNKTKNKDAKDEMNIFQCVFPGCKRNYFNLRDWSVHYRYHVNKHILINL